jgi:hypothetical protein
MTHPYTDPFHNGLVQASPSQRLMNADAYRQRPAKVAGIGGPEGGGGDLNLSGVKDVLDAAGYQPPGEQEGGEEPAEQAPARQPIQSDADAPNQGVFSDGVNMHHVRMSGPSTAGLPGTGYGIATHVGAPGDGAI